MFLCDAALQGKALFYLIFVALTKTFSPDHSVEISLGIYEKIEATWGEDTRMQCFFLLFFFQIINLSQSLTSNKLGGINFHLNQHVHQRRTVHLWRQPPVSKKLRLFIFFVVSVVSLSIWEGYRGAYVLPKYLAGRDPWPAQSNLRTS